MTKKLKHIAVIPARAGSVGFPKKNQIFFDNTADFLKDLSWLDEVIVTSDDTAVLDKAKRRKYNQYLYSIIYITILIIIANLVNAFNFSACVIPETGIIAKLSNNTQKSSNQKHLPLFFTLSIPFILLLSFEKINYY